MQSVADFPWRWTHVDETALIRAGQGALHTVVINYLDTALIILYDGIDAAGNVMGIITTALSQPVTLIYDAKLYNGLYIEIVSLNGGTADLTVNWI